MESQMDSWRGQAKEISTTAGILAAAETDQLGKKKEVINVVLTDEGVYGIGEPTVEYWQNRTQETYKFCVLLAATRTGLWNQTKQH